MSNPAMLIFALVTVFFFMTMLGSAGGALDRRSSSASKSGVTRYASGSVAPASLKPFNRS